MIAKVDMGKRTNADGPDHSKLVVSEGRKHVLLSSNGRRIEIEAAIVGWNGGETDQSSEM